MLLYLALRCSALPIWRAHIIIDLLSKYIYICVQGLCVCLLVEQEWRLLLNHDAYLTVVRKCMSPGWTWTLWDVCMFAVLVGPHRHMGKTGWCWGLITSSVFLHHVSDEGKLLLLALYVSIILVCVFFRAIDGGRFFSSLDACLLVTQESMPFCEARMCVSLLGKRNSLSCHECKLLSKQDDGLQNLTALKNSSRRWTTGFILKDLSKTEYST